MKTSQTIILVTLILTGLLLTEGGKQQAIEQDSGPQLLVKSPGKGEIDSPRLKTSTLEPHAPIYIDGNLNFAGNASFEGWEGYGNGTHPYIIENYNITTGAAGTSGIEIRNTDVHFIIRDCFTRATGTNAHGIYLYQVKNSTLEGNIASNNSDAGIRLDSSSNNTVSGNNASNNTYHGFYLYGSSTNNTLSGNTASNNGYQGFYLFISSHNNTLTGNFASDNNYGIFLCGSSNNTLSGNTASNNSLGFFLGSTSNNTLSGNTASKNRQNGIHLSSSFHNTLSGNTASNNGYQGFSLGISSNNTLSGNNARYNNVYGFFLGSNSTNNTLSGNTVISNDRHGLYLASSDYNAIYLNEFIGSNRGAVQAYADTDTNVFTNGSHGNFWGDYTGIDTTGDGIGEMPYSIDGGAGAEDPHPLMVSSIGVLTWPGQLLALNGTVTNISDWTWQPLQTSALAIELWLNNASQGNQSGPFSWSFTLIEGNNNITAVAFFDANGPVTWPRTFLVTLDITPPAAVITGLTDQQTVSAALMVQVSPSDANGIARVKFELDGSVVHTDSDSPYTWTWDTATVTDGSHIIKIHTYDVAENVYTSGPYTVTVDNAASTTTTGMIGMGIIAAIAAGGAGRVVSRRVRKRKMNEKLR